MGEEEISYLHTLILFHVGLLNSIRDPTYKQLSVSHLLVAAVYNRKSWSSALDTPRSSNLLGFIHS